MHSALRQRIEMMRGKIERSASVVEVPASSQLFVSSDEICSRLVDLANISNGDRILEPNAGTGAIVRAIRKVAPAAVCDAVEINAELCQHLRNEFAGLNVICSDFLEYWPHASEGNYSRIIMNPPFNQGADIKHILHARSLLIPGGVLTAVCLNGPRQNNSLKPLSDHWEPLPRGAFVFTDASTVILRLVAD